MPGGFLQIHGLMADKPLPDGVPTLSGLALLIKHINVVDEVLGFLSSRGFRGVDLINPKESTPRFTLNGIRIGETHIRLTSLNNSRRIETESCCIRGRSASHATTWATSTRVVGALRWTLRHGTCFDVGQQQTSSFFMTRMLMKRKR